MAPKRKAGAKGTPPRATRAKSAASASSDTVGIPELFKKVKADLQPDALKPKPQLQEKAAREPATVARSDADGAGGSGDAAAAARAPTVPLVEAALPPQAPLTAEEDELLRDFDLDIAFGPSLGLTRKERWQRAEGAPPPARHPTSCHTRDPLHLTPELLSPGLGLCFAYTSTASPTCTAHPNCAASASSPASASISTSTTSDSQPFCSPQPVRLRLGP